MRALLALGILVACNPPATGPILPDDTGSAPPELFDTGPPEDVGSPCDGRIYPEVVVNELVSANVQGITDQDEETSDWLEIANLDTAAVDLEGWGLSDDPGDTLSWVLPARSLEPGEILLVFASGKDSVEGELHASFSVAAGDEEGVVLAASDGCIVDRVEPGRLYGDISYGRTAEDSDSWGYFIEPTPGEANTSESRPGFAATPSLSPDPGFYEQAVSVEASSSEVSATLRLTYDGAAPDEGSELYEDPVEVSAQRHPAVVRARAWVDGLWPSRIATATYSQTNEPLDYGLDVVSLVVDPFDLYDEKTGIYAYGLPDYVTSYPYFGANFWEDWERDAHVQIFQSDGTLVVDQDTGVRIHGGYTRAFEQKSFRILARAAYGPDTLDYQFFPHESLDSYEIMVLEGVGDWCPTHTENAFVSEVFRDADDLRFPTIDTEAWEPIVVYLNGEFWGLYAYREKLDQHYIAAHHGADEDNLDRIECTADGTPMWWRINQGTWQAFDEMNMFVDENDLSDPDAWAEFQTMMEIESFATAILAQGYWGNTDWWNNNLKLWREREEDHPFRHMVFDLGHSWPSYSYDHIGVSVNFSDLGMPVADALANEEFRVLLANQASDFLNTNLAVENALPRLDEMHARIEPVIADQYAMWCGQPKSYWDSSVSYARDFVQLKPAVLWNQIETHLHLDGTVELTLEADPPGAGTFFLTVVEVEPPFTGSFFRRIPISVTAQPEAGYGFAGWSDGSLGGEATVSFELTEDGSLTGYFE